MRVPGNIIDVGGGHSGHSSRNRGRKDRNTVKFCCSLIFGYIRHLRKKTKLKSADVDCGFSHCRITRQSAGSWHCRMNTCIVLGQWLFVIDGQLEFRCIVSSPLCGCRLVDGSLPSCCSRLHLRALHVTRLPANRFHPLVFVLCLLVFIVASVAYLCHIYVHVVIVSWMTNVFATLAEEFSHSGTCKVRISKSMDENKTLTKGEK